MRVFIENEAGSRRKNTYDESTLQFLSSVDVSAAYPFPYGFVIGTRSEDGDAVDCFVITDQKLAAGSTVDCEAFGLLEQIEDNEIDHKILAVPAGTKPAADADAAMLATLREFATNVFAHIPGKHLKLGQLLGRDAAETYLAEGRTNLSSGNNTIL